MTLHTTKHPAASSCAHLHLDEALLVVSMDDNAEAMLTRNHGVLRLVQRRLLAPQAQADLDRCLTQAAAGQPSGMLVARDAPWPLTLVCTPSPKPAQHRTGVVVRLRDPLGEQPDQAWLQRLFDLTPAEADITAALAMGRHCVEIALARGVQANTVRAHLKRAMAKTGTSHQVALVSLVLRSAAMVVAAAGEPRAR